MTARVLALLAYAGCPAVVAVMLTDRPAEIPALLGYVGYLAFTLLATAALAPAAPEPHDGPESCVTRDPFVDGGEQSHLLDCTEHYFPLPEELGCDPDSVGWAYGNCACGAQYDGSYDEPFAGRVTTDQPQGA